MRIISGGGLEWSITNYLTGSLYSNDIINIDVLLKTTTKFDNIELYINSNDTPVVSKVVETTTINEWVKIPVF